MLVVALLAVDLALVRTASSLLLIAPTRLLATPAFWLVLGILNYLILWKLIFRRTFRAANYTFLIVLVIASLVLTNQVAAERIHPMGPLIRWYQQIKEDYSINVTLIEIGSIGDFWMACLMGVILAWGAGFLSSWLERRRGWDIAAFWRGALAGFGIFSLISVLDWPVWGMPAPGRVGLLARWSFLAVSVLGGGIVGLSRLRSQPEEIDRDVSLIATTPQPKSTSR
jgi:hypothetical protein